MINFTDLPDDYSIADAYFFDYRRPDAGLEFKDEFDRLAAKLSGREAQVLDLAGQGYSVPEAALELGISEEMIQGHIEKIQEVACASD